MSNVGAKKYNENALLVMGFLGGIAFAGLILVLQARSIFQVKVAGFDSPQAYFGFITFMLGLDSSVAVVGSFASLVIASERVRPDGMVSEMAEWLHFVATMLFLMTMPLLFLPFVRIAWTGDVLFLIDVGMLFVLLLFMVREKIQNQNHL